jgi:hypothetical protein
MVSRRIARSLIVLFFFACGQAGICGMLHAANHPAAAPQIKAFEAGETLTYDISWLNLVRAGTAVLTVREERRSDGSEVLRFVVTSRTVGIVRKLYPLGNVVQSVFSPRLMQSLSYSLEERHGKKTRRRELVFDHANKTVRSRRNQDPPKTLSVPEEVQDPLSALYYLRTRRDFAVGPPVTFTVFDGSESVGVEVRTLGRELVKTPAGGFSTLKVRAQKGLFLSQGEIVLWLTDDLRKIPVLIKSRIAAGSLVFTLTNLKPGGGPEAQP